MIGIELLTAEIPGLRLPDLERWIGNDWVRPGHDGNAYVFVEVDVARIRLIRELRDELQIDEDALPVVLMLLDQLYDLRRRMRELGTAIERTVPDEIRQALARDLAKSGSG